jgi:hypothetical protein
MNEEELIERIFDEFNDLASKEKKPSPAAHAPALVVTKRKEFRLKASAMHETAAVVEGPPLKKQKGFSGKTIKHFPQEEMTGVSETMTRICATISGQLYQVDGDKSKFKLSHLDVKVLDFETQGDYSETTPPFVIAKTGSTMIIGWRGSSNIMDWTGDFNASPVVSEATRGLRIQSSFLSLVESDFALHGEKIVNLIGTDTSEVIFTGHSLGGALAQVAHILVVANKADSSSMWHDAHDAKVVFRTLVFSAPMCIAIEPDDTAKGKNKEIIELVQSHTCNIIYSYDPVPRCYSMLDYLLKVLNAVIDHIGWGRGWAVKNLFLPKRLAALLEHGVEGSATTTDENKASFKKLFKVLFRFRHLGTLVYYENADAKPHRMVDTGPTHPEESTSQTSDELTLESIQFAQFDLSKVSTDEIAETHNFLVTGQGLAYNNK